MTQQEIEAAEFAHNPYLFERDGAKVVGAFQQGFMAGVKWMQENTPDTDYDTIENAGYKRGVKTTMEWISDHWRSYVWTDIEGTIHFGLWEKELESDLL